MNRNEARDYIRGQIESYLQAKGINTRKPFSCLNPAHSDKNPSMSYDHKRGKAHCFSCGADYDTIDLIGIDYGLTEAGAIFDKARELYGIQIEGANMQQTRTNTTRSASANSAAAPARSAAQPQQAQRPEQDYTAYFEETHRHITETDYPQRRGLTAATIERFSLGYDAAFETTSSTGTRATWKALIIPTGRGHFVARNTDAEASGGDRIRKRGPNSIFNLEALKQSEKPVFVVEGEIDALSIIEAGGEAVGLGSTSNTGKLMQALEGIKLSKPLLLSMDDDEAGKKAQAELAEKLHARGVPFLEADINGGHKDANEALQEDRDGLRAAIAEAQEADAREREKEKLDYLQTSAAGHIDDFLIEAGSGGGSAPTGFPRLDKALGGGLRKGLYIIGAIPSLGKTTFALQIGDNIAKQGKDVLIFSLEMERTELMAKSISRLSKVYCSKMSYEERRYAKRVLDIVDNEKHALFDKRDKEVFDKALAEYEAYAKNIFISEGVGSIGAAEIRATIEKHKRITGNTPIVIVDYLQIIAPYSDRASDKQNTDKAVLELKRISRDFKTPIIGISSFNRDNYSASASMAAFKESGAIEYGCDVLIGLQLAGVSGDKNEFNVDEAKAKDPREIELKILKNRNGPSGGTIEYKFKAAYNLFEEQEIKSIGWGAAGKRL